MGWLRARGTGTELRARGTEHRGKWQVVQAEEWNDEVPLRGILQVVLIVQDLQDKAKVASDGSPPAPLSGG